MVGVDENLFRKRKRRAKRDDEEERRKSAKVQNNVDNDCFSSSTERCELGVKQEVVAVERGFCKRIPKGTRGTKECITPDLVSVFDRCKLSDVAAVRILIAAARAFQCDPKQYIINQKSIRQARTQNRQQLAVFLKENPQVIKLKQKSKSTL